MMNLLKIQFKLILNFKINPHKAGKTQLRQFHFLEKFEQISYTTGTNTK